MQSWDIKIDIKLNIDGLNRSVDGQIIEDIKPENVFSHVSYNPELAGNKSSTITRLSVTIFYI